MEPLITFQEKLGYQFREPRLLIEALTHKSYAYEKRQQPGQFAHNERMEFLGDAVLDLIVSDLLMHFDLDATEGELSKRRAALVNEEVLALVAREILLGPVIMLGRGEDNSGGREKNSILASTFEGLLGAIYLDGGFAECQKLIKALFTHRVQSLPRQTPFERDYKTRLQEAVQGKYKAAPTYQVEHTEGPDHQKVFRVGVHMGDRKLGTGVGRSRKEAEQEAARIVLTEMEL